jgi:hypothetical protein
MLCFMIRVLFVTCKKTITIKCIYIGYNYHEQNYDKTSLAHNLHHKKHEYAPKDANM